LEPKELNPKQQISEAIRAAESLLIVTGQNPSVDQVAAVVALAQILNKLDKKTDAIVSDSPPAGARFFTEGALDRGLGSSRDFIIQVDLSQAEVDNIRYNIDGGKLNIHVAPFKGGFSSDDVSFSYGDFQYDLVVALGVPSFTKLDRLYLQNHELFADTPLVNIDFHRINESFGAINLVDTNAASLCEMLVALSESLQSGMIDKDLATVLLTGIMGATDRFTATHTTPKALTVAAQMMAAGADQQKVVRGLYNRGDRNDRSDRPDRRNDPKPASTPKAPQAQSAQRKPEPMRQASTEPAPAQPKAPEPTALTAKTEPTERATWQSGKQLIAGGKIEKVAAEVKSSDEADDPIVTEPFTIGEPIETHPQQAAFTDEPEPLINGEPEMPEIGKPQPESVEQQPQKAPNPANNPFFNSREL
jgi:nanoRNase/pAp phosphatase (c-di-AMP/oligoRNAs hydrolase)